jgi:hypothetical protein
MEESQMTQEQHDVMVYRDSGGSLYLRIPDDHRSTVEAAMDDSSGYFFGSDGGVSAFQAGRLTPIDVIPLQRHGGSLQNSLQTRGIIIVGG